MSIFDSLVHKASAYRRPIVVAVHMGAIVASNYTAFLLRFDGVIPDDERQLMLHALPWLLVLRGVLFIPFGLYSGLWRYAGLWDLGHIIAATAVSSLLFTGFTQIMVPAYSRSVIIIDALLLVCVTGGLRLTRRLYRLINQNPNGKRVLVYGAGSAGELIVRDMRNNPLYTYRPIGFIDDDTTKHGQQIHGVTVLGGGAALQRIMSQDSPDEILIAMPTASPATIRAVIRALESFKVPIKTLPNLRDLPDSAVHVNQIRSLKLEDLLPRVPVGLDSADVVRLIKGRCILLTGAGGSIGSELARQIMAFEPDRLVLFERHENSIYSIHAELSDLGYESRLWPVVGDVTDGAHLERVMSHCRPTTIFHAAAHKHVPLMEQNPCEAVKNNVRGTRVLADVAQRLGVQRMIMISTDKAVNPISVMGATKRVAELVIRSRAPKPTSFSAVRFGNVLGSNGSIVPRLLRQIETGGPVTITHPEMRRYFMLIPEAVHLVLHAGAQAVSSDIYVLDMGEQIKLLDLARNLIRLSGFVPDEEIEIKLVGVRPGDKLSEELVARDERVVPSPVNKVLRIVSGEAIDSSILDNAVAALEAAADQNNEAETIDCLRRIVPEFSPCRTAIHNGVSVA